MSSRLSKFRSVHTYVMLRTVYFGWICTFNANRLRIQSEKRADMGTFNTECVCSHFNGSLTYLVYINSRLRPWVAFVLFYLTCNLFEQYFKAVSLQNVLSSQLIEARGSLRGSSSLFASSSTYVHTPVHYEAFKFFKSDHKVSWCSLGGSSLLFASSSTYIHLWTVRLSNFSNLTTKLADDVLRDPLHVF